MSKNNHEASFGEWADSQRQFPNGEPDASTDNVDSPRQNTLLPCPFCKEHHVTVSEYDTKDMWWAQCDNIHCGASGPPRKTKLEAVAAWNRLVPEAAPRQMECEELAIAREAAASILDLCAVGIVHAEPTAHYITEVPELILAAIKKAKSLAPPVVPSVALYHRRTQHYCKTCADSAPVLVKASDPTLGADSVGRGNDEHLAHPLSQNPAFCSPTVTLREERI